MRRVVALGFMGMALAGCYDDHGRGDADELADAALADAGGLDANRDATVPIDGFDPCLIGGRRVAATPGSAPSLQRCGCPGGTVAGIQLRAPAPLALEHGPLALCIPTRSYEGVVVGLCPQGLVLHRDQGTAEADAAGVDFTADLEFVDAGCLDVESCLFADQQLPRELRGGCLYADYSPVETGELPEPDCGALQEGLCSINCPCDREWPECWGLSERHPIGVCTRAPFCIPRSPGARCGLPGEVCAIVASPPDFAAAMAGSPMGGRCVPADACDALAAVAGDTWACMDTP